MKTAALVLLCFVLSGCAHVHIHTSPFIALEVVTVRVEPNAFTMRANDHVVDAVDLAVVKVETPGRFHNLTLPIAIPSPETNNFDAVAVIPERARMLDYLRTPARRLAIEVRTTEVQRYLENKDDPSRLLPSIHLQDLKSVDPRDAHEAVAGH